MQLSRARDAGEGGVEMGCWGAVGSLQKEGIPRQGLQKLYMVKPERSRGTHRPRYRRVRKMKGKGQG